MGSETDRKKLTIVIPVYNEIHTIEKIVKSGEAISPGNMETAHNISIDRFGKASQDTFKIGGNISHGKCMPIMPSTSNDPIDRKCEGTG